MNAADRAVDSSGRCRIQDNTCRTSRPWLTYETPANDRPGPIYSALDLMGEVYLSLWGAGVVPPGPMRDPEAAQRACADLLRAFGIVPAEAVSGSSRAASAVAAVCGVAA